MHMVTINNNATCNTGHLHISSLAYSKHRCHQNYNKNFEVCPTEAGANFVHQAKIDFRDMSNIETYSKT